MKFSLSLLATTGLVVALAGSASAHISLTFPVARTVKNTGQKGAPPCGVMGPKNPQKFRPGETIMVKWDETVSHVGRFRIAFDDDGMDFPAPVTRKDTNTTLPIFLDGLFEKTKGGPMGLHQQQITFPNKPCANCMLQVIQVMIVDPPYQTSAGENVYYQCADIVLEGEPMGGGGTDAGAPGGADAGAGSGGSSGTGGSAATGGSSGTGGTTAGTGGSSNSGGSTGSGGSSASGGSTGTGGSSSGGSSGSSGGASGSKGGSTGSGSGSGGSAPSTPPDSPPASCTMGSDRQPISGLGFVALIGVALFLRRRRA
jgi:hypothetical protein